MSRAQLVCCYAFLIAGLLIALCSAAHRIQADRAYKDVIVLLDWHALNALPSAGDELALSAGAATAASGSATPWTLLSAIPGAQLCYGEETIGTLLAQGIIQRAWLTTGAPAFAVMDPDYADDIAKGAARHGYWYERSPATDSRLVFQVPDLPEEELVLLPVAWLESVIAAARDRGVGLILRPGGSEFSGENGISATLGYVARQPLVLFQGPTVLGYPGNLHEVADILRDQGQTFGWVEFDEQDGAATIAQALAPAVVRVHSIPAEEMVDYFGAPAVDRYLRAVTERNIRCIYVRPFIRGGPLGGEDSAGYRQRLLNYNQDFFAQLSGALTAAGFTVAATVAPPKGPPQWLRYASMFTAALATGAVLALLLAMWLPLWPRGAWTLILAGSVLLGAAAAFMPGMAGSLVLLAAALVFPLWGIWWALTLYQRITARIGCGVLCPRRIFIAMFALVIASLASIAGGLMIHGALWSAETMLKVGQFRGVTLALAVPILLFAAYAWQAETLQDAYDAGQRRLTDFWQRFLQLWSAPIRYGDIAFIMIAVGALAIVLLRSGNESPLEVLSVETWFRGSLEDWFSLRPRTKELIGHPFLILFLISLPWRTRLSLLFGLAGVLGQVSILNTFCHLHTPLMVTVVRVLLGLGLGLVSGLLWGVVAVVAGRLVQYARSRFAQPAGT